MDWLHHPCFLGRPESKGTKSLGCTIRKVAGSPPQNAGAVNLKKTYENASTSFKHGGLQQIPLFGKTYGAGAVKKCTAKETCPKVCHNATENTYVKRG